MRCNKEGKCQCLPAAFKGDGLEPHLMLMLICTVGMVTMSM